MDELGVPHGYSSKLPYFFHRVDGRNPAPVDESHDLQGCNHDDFFHPYEVEGYSANVPRKFRWIFHICHRLKRAASDRPIRPGPGGEEEALVVQAPGDGIEFLSGGNPPGNHGCHGCDLAKAVPW